MEFSSEAIKKVKINKRQLEKKLKVRIEIKGNNVELEGKSEDIFIGERILEAIDKGFSVKTALLLTHEDYVLGDIQIKNIRDRNIMQTKARIIGTRGKTIKTLCELSECHITIHDNIVSIIGPSETIKEATTAIENLIRGSKQTNVYRYLERCKKEEKENLS